MTKKELKANYPSCKFYKVNDPGLHPGVYYTLVVKLNQQGSADVKGKNVFLIDEDGKEAWRGTLLDSLKFFTTLFIRLVDDLRHEPEMMGS